MFDGDYGDLTGRSLDQNLVSKRQLAKAALGMGGCLRRSPSRRIRQTVGIINSVFHTQSRTTYEKSIRHGDLGLKRDSTGSVPRPVGNSALHARVHFHFQNLGHHNFIRIPPTEGSFNFQHTLRWPHQHTDRPQHLHSTHPPPHSQIPRSALHSLSPPIHRLLNVASPRTLHKPLPPQHHIPCVRHLFLPRSPQSTLANEVQASRAMSPVSRALQGIRAS